MSPPAFTARLDRPLADLCAFAGRHSAYLRTLMARRPHIPESLGEQAPELVSAQICERVRAAGRTGTLQELERSLRLAKADMHLLVALADIGGVWELEEVTAQLSAFADAAMQAALHGAARDLQARGMLPALETDADSGPLPGLFVIAMGKFGARELNYSSDVDFTLFFNPQTGADWLGRDPQRTTARLVRPLVRLLSFVTADGYVFRTDMRLRPDPGSTNPVVSTTAARVYYETRGQNWERAALIKARCCAGDRQAAKAFLAELQPFIWRRSLDFAAIEDIHAMKRQIHVSLHKSGFAAAGHDVKLGRGGIREIEFFTQTQQLILGGRDPDLRVAQTCAALKALADAGHIDEDSATGLCASYRLLRRAEHGAQMLYDQQTHTLPRDEQKRAAIAALCGAPDLPAFDAQMQRAFRQVHSCYARLFAHSAPLATEAGSLVFTGVEDDPATLAALREKGFEAPHVFLERMRAWHGGSVRATRTERARALLTRLGPALVNALAATGSPDHAFTVFARFFENLNAGVQTLSLLCARPEVLQTLVDLLNTAPRLALAFSRRVSVLDAMLDPGFSMPIADDPELGARRLAQCAQDDLPFEALLDAIRRTALEERLRIGVQVLTARAGVEDAARSYSALAGAAIGVLAEACMAQMRSRFGPEPGQWAVLGMGSLGAQTMHEGSDLDLMVLYDSGATAPEAENSGLYFARFTRRLINALSAQTREGALYSIDMKLRPSGRAGPVAVSWPGFRTYYRESAWSWEILALGRARPIHASSNAFARTISAAIAGILKQDRDAKAMARDVADMRRRLREEFASAGPWDLKHAPGGLVETELLRQFIGICGHQALSPDARARARQVLDRAFTLQSGLMQSLRLCLPASGMQPPFPAPVQALLARRAETRDFDSLENTLARAQAGVTRLADQIVM